MLLLLLYTHAYGLSWDCYNIILGGPNFDQDKSIDSHVLKSTFITI